MAATPIEIIPGRLIGHGLPSFIVAEIGINHNGNIDMAKQLIQAAKEAGADCVKLQKGIKNWQPRKSHFQKYFTKKRKSGIPFINMISKTFIV